MKLILFGWSVLGEREHEGTKGLLAATRIGKQAESLDACA